MARLAVWMKNAGALVTVPDSRPAFVGQLQELGNMQCYLVGGAVRDKLLGLPVKERDWVVVGATPEDLQTRGFKPVGRDFPVFLHPETDEEYALARTERKTGRGYTGFQFYSKPDVSLEQDLARRDLTINAIAEDEHGQLIDPYGGRADLEQRLLRHVSPAFVEDPVRLLRVARFLARFAPLGFRVADETLALLRQMVADGEVDHLVPERVWAEWHKALNTPEPAAFVRLLRQVGALARILPELDALFGVPQPPRHHPEIDSGVHSLMTLSRATALSDDPDVRFAALIHDLGKAQTPAQDWPRHIAHEQRSLPLIKQLCRRLAVPNAFRDLALAVAAQHTNVHRALALRPQTVVKVLEQLDAFRRPARFAQTLLACQADAQGRTGLTATPYPQADFFRAALAACQAVDPRDLVAEGLSGAALGEALRQRRAQAVAALDRNRFSASVTPPSPSSESSPS